MSSLQQGVVVVNPCKFLKNETDEKQYFAFQANQGRRHRAESNSRFVSKTQF